MKTQTWQVIRKRDFPPSTKELSGKLVLKIKNLCTEHENPKAHYVALENKDEETSLLLHDINTLRQSFTRMIVCVAAVKRFRIFGHDINQAYLQSDKNAHGKCFTPKQRGLRSFWS